MFKELIDILPVHYRYLTNLKDFKVDELNNKNNSFQNETRDRIYMCHFNYKAISDIDLYIK
jgi:hypothetical protein